jgi:hypothetical protein
MPDVQKILTVDFATGLNALITPTVTGGSTSAAGQIVALDTDGTLNESLLPSGLGVSVVTAKASEDITADSIVNLYKEGADWLVRNAIGTDASKYAVGFIKSTVVEDAESVDVYLEGRFTFTSTSNHLFLTTTAGTPGVYDLDDGNLKIRQLVGRRVGENLYEFIQGDITLLNPST